MIAARLGTFAGQVRRWRMALPTVAVLLGVYAAVLHPWLMSWGATAAEIATSLPGDEHAAGPVTYFTRAITIDAPPEAVWPWLVQMGQDRAGFYSNDWLENVAGIAMRNADRIHPEWQGREVGDVVRLVPDGYFGGLAGSAMSGKADAAVGPRIWLLRPGEAIADAPGRFILISIDGHRTRLLFRESVESQGPLVSRWVAWDPTHFVMVQRMLRGIKERAEGRPLVPSGLLLVARAGWMLAGLAVLGLFLARPGFRPWVLPPVALAVPALVTAGDWSAALAGFLALGITILGALAFGRRWWPPFLLLASGVLLVLLLAPDAYAALGLLFDLAGAILLVGALRRVVGSHRVQQDRTPARVG